MQHLVHPAGLSRWADVYLPVCACCTGWRIFCTASVDRQTHCNSSSQLLLLLLVCWASFSSKRDSQRRACVQKEECTEIIVKHALPNQRLSTYPRISWLFFWAYSIGIAEQYIISMMEQFTVWVTFGRSSVIHSVFPFIFCFVSEFPLFSLLHLSPPLSTGSLGIRLFFAEFGTGPNPNQMFTHRHPKYMKAHSAP